jgi:cell division protein FtsQ
MTETPRVYTRERRAIPRADRFSTRLAARAAAVLFLAATVGHGLAAGGHLDYDGSPWQKLPGKFAGLFGLAAQDIKITGLKHQQPEQVLAAIGVKPGRSLIGFDAKQARNLLENIDWVEQATVMRKFPNELEIDIVERTPFAIWQREGAQYVIDKTGTAMSSLDPKRMGHLLVVTGEGAQKEAEGLINLLEAYPDLKSTVRGAARVGLRRWTLYLDNGIKVALPELNAGEAMARVEELDRTYGIFRKGVATVDLRIADRAVFTVAEVPAEPKVSRR